jgi:hypothetical protein
VGVSPKLKSLLARVTLVGGVALVATFTARNAPHDQTIAIRCSGHDVRHIDAVVTLFTGERDEEPSAGFSQDFVGGAPSLVRHTFSAPNGTYIVVITFRETVTGSAGDLNPIPTETTFERRVSLSGGEVIVSPD